MTRVLEKDGQFTVAAGEVLRQMPTPHWEEVGFFRFGPQTKWRGASSQAVRARMTAPRRPRYCLSQTGKSGITVGKQSDAKRKAKLKDRRKKAEATLVRAVVTQNKVAEWVAAHDAEPNIIAELVDDSGDVLAYVSGVDQRWTVVVDDQPVAGASDEFVALSFFLGAAVDDRAAGNTPFIQFAPWLLEEIEKRCEAANTE